MKQITNKTALKQGDKTYQPIEVDGVIYWVDKEAKIEKGKFFITKENIVHNNTGWNYGDVVIVAQSQHKLDGIPVVSLDSYADSKYYQLHWWKKNLDFKETEVDTLEKKSFGKGFKSNPNQYTQADIDKAMSWARDRIESNEEILEKINSISVIEVDENFNVIGYDN
jgi:hypothetical protein